MAKKVKADKGCLDQGRCRLELRKHSKARTPVAKISKQMKGSRCIACQQAFQLGIGLGHQRAS